MNMVDDVAISVVGLRKCYRNAVALEGINLTVQRGSTYALLGPRGSGKTTTVRILSTLARPDGGYARVAGFDVVQDRHEVQRRIGLTGQSLTVDAMQTGEENLRMLGRLFRLSPRQARRRAAELLELHSLGGAAKLRVREYSDGMRRRLDLAASLVVQPSVIYLDEPTAGLEPRSRQAIWQAVRELSGSGATIFLTTRLPEEADRLADRVGILNRGRVVAEGAPADLKLQVASHRLELTLMDGLAYRHVVDSFDLGLLDGEVLSSDPRTRTIVVLTDGSASHARTLLDRIDPMCTLVKGFTPRSATLDDVYLALTGLAACGCSQRETADV